MDFAKLCLKHSDDLKLPPLPASFIECKFLDETNSISVDPYTSNAPLPFGNSTLIKSNIVGGRILTKGDDVNEAIELTLNLKEPYDFLPGDTVGIFPQNAIDEVNGILKRLKLLGKADQPMDISLKDGVKKKLPLYLPQQSTPRILLESVLEIRGIIKKAFLRSLAEYTSEPDEKRRLLELSSQEGSGEYDKYFLQLGITLYDLLIALPSCSPPLSLLLEHLPRLMPRAYSIASSPLSTKTKIKIVFNLLATPSGKLGICSNWLKSKFLELSDVSKQFEKLGIGDSSEFLVSSTIPLFFRKPSQFRVPDNSDTPLVMIGPGTGIAPFLGFLEHFEHANKDVEKEEQTQCLHVVYFGCRYRNRDHIYKSEIEDYVNKKLLSQYRVCHSRDHRSESDPKYVQDLLYSDRNHIYELINNSNANVFICGDAKNMVKDVQATLVKIIKECSGMSDEEALVKLDTIEKEGKLIKDVWSP